MVTMTTHERMTRIFEHREADRIPISDYPWAATVERWQGEGLPVGCDIEEYLGLDRIVGITADISPRYEEHVIEETEEYVIATTAWGATMKNFKHSASTPECLDFKIVDAEAWFAARKRMTPDPDRVDWAKLAAEYPRWRTEGRWIEAWFWFGFDVSHSWAVGTERLLTAMVMDPEWITDMFNHYLDMNIALFEMIWEKGYRFDSIKWPDDMGYKHSQFFSLKTYRSMLKPVHQRAAQWAHNHGIKAHLHSCGDVNPFIPELIEIGIDALNPLEVKAGMDPLALKEKYGSSLVLHGGLNALLYDQPDVLEAEIRRLIPTMKQNGGFIFSSDHSIPSSISLRDFQRVIALAKELGTY
jgi:uroporphyrinogen decarboxylase